MPQNPSDVYDRNVRTAALNLDPAQKAGINALQRLFDDLVAAPAPRKNVFPFINSARKRGVKGVYLHGDVGRGKSMLMNIFHDSLSTILPARRVHFHDFMIEVHNFMHVARQKEKTGGKVDAALLKHADAIAAGCRVLCFDEFHVTDIADAMILGRLFTALWERGVVVVATSNWPPDRLYEDGLQRDRFLPFIATLKNHMEIVEIAGDTDYRLKYLTDAGVYFWPLGPTAQGKADLVFANLTDGVSPQTDVLEIKGRELKIDVTAKNVARFRFSQLCEQPLGAEDYLAIARRYHTVFLDSIPKLGYDRRNEAKRLMILIDALYESGTKLIVTADAPANQLYRGHDHGFEFQRTESRLMEMQGHDYLARNTKSHIL